LCFSIPRKTLRLAGREHGRAIPLGDIAPSGEQRRGYFEAERLRGDQVVYEVKLGWLLHRDVGGLHAAQNSHAATDGGFIPGGRRSRALSHTHSGTPDIRTAVRCGREHRDICCRETRYELQRRGRLVTTTQVIRPTTHMGAERRASERLIGTVRRGLSRRTCNEFLLLMRRITIRYARTCP
jgi:hypothetical protein